MSSQAQPKIVAMIVGNVLIGRRVRAQGAPLGFDLFKRRNARIGGLVDLVALMGNYAATAALLAAFNMQLDAGTEPGLPPL